MGEYLEFAGGVHLHRIAGLQREIVARGHRPTHHHLAVFEIVLDRCTRSLWHGLDKKCQQSVVGGYFVVFNIVGPGRLRARAWFGGKPFLRFHFLRVRLVLQEPHRPAL